MNSKSKDASYSNSKKTAVVYADHAATTRLDSDAFLAMKPFLKDTFGNPSTLYGLAEAPKKAIAEARRTIAASIGAQADEVIFTSGGTESDNFVIKGIGFRYLHEKKRIITSAIEHHAILRSCDFLQTLGYEIVYLPADRKGVVKPDVLARALTDDTALVSIMLANNEIGTIEPIKELAKVAHSRGVLFHTDAVQAVGHMPIDVGDLDVDFLSASAHKFNGPRGTGFLFIRRGVEIPSFISGGGQENNLRGGTENTAGIVGMSVALRKNVEEMDSRSRHLKNLSVHFVNELSKTGLDYVLNGSEERLPGSFSISFRGAEGEMILHRMDLLGVEIATGSACNSKETETSHVLRAIGVPKEYIDGTIRITFGYENTYADVDKIITSLTKILL